MNLDWSLTTAFSSGKEMTSRDYPSRKINPSCSCPSVKVPFNTLPFSSHQSHSTAKVSGLLSPEFLSTTPAFHRVQRSSLIFPSWSCFWGAAFLPSHPLNISFVLSVLFFPSWPTFPLANIFSHLNQLTPSSKPHLESFFASCNSNCPKLAAAP